MKLDIEDMKNRSLRKTLILKNIPQPKKWESWDKSKDILTKEIRSAMPTFEETVIRDKIERAHWSRENEYHKNPAIIEKFNNWEFTESIKTSFIRAKSQICVSQMYSPALTKRRNEAMKVRKDLKRNEPNIQAYVKFPAQLMIKKEKRTESTVYMLNISFLCFLNQKQYIYGFFRSTSSHHAPHSQTLPTLRLLYISVAPWNNIFQNMNNNLLNLYPLILCNNKSLIKLNITVWGLNSHLVPKFCPFFHYFI